MHVDTLDIECSDHFLVLMVKKWHLDRFEVEDVKSNSKEH